MARTSNSLDLSEFFDDDDDSEGHRLVEFIQRRRGGFKRKDILFMNDEPQRLSLKVQLEKLPNSKAESCKSNGNQVEHEAQQNFEQGALPSEQLAGDFRENLGEPRLPGDPISSILTSRALTPLSAMSTDDQPLNNPVCPISPGRSRSHHTDGNAYQPPNSLNSISARLSVIRKSGGVSPGDRLRRYSLRRLTKLCGGRRTLLQEFESTIKDKNFNPPVCSTPLSQSTPVKLPPASNSGQPLEAENVGQNAPTNGHITGGSCCSHTDSILKSLQHKDEELRNYIGNVIGNTMKNMQNSQEKNKSSVGTTKSTTPLNSTKSPLKRTYIVANESVPGQVTLNPNISSQKQTHSKDLNSQNKGSKIVQMASSHKAQQQENSSPNTPTVEFVVNNTLKKRNMSIVLSTEVVEVSESHRERLKLQSDGGTPVVIVPINQTINKTCSELVNNNSIERAKPKESNINSELSATKATEAIAETNDNQCYQLEEDNLKLSDVLTDDDDDEVVKSGPVEVNSQLPLDLAPSGSNSWKKRLRKASISRRRLNNNSQLHSTESEVQLPPQAHSNKRISKKRKHKPLNSAPGIPLNGEQFAQELARMSNYEILDLRKRNSMGQIFSISCCKSRRLHEDAMKKTHQLENQLEKEITRRNLTETAEKQKLQNNLTYIDGKGLDEQLPVPDEFRDSLLTQGKTANYCREDSFLLDVNDSNRVSFKINESKSRAINGEKKRNKVMSEVLKQYLEVSKSLSQRKSQNFINRSKRSLYTQDVYEFENHNSTNVTLEKRDSICRTRSIPYVPSPPKSDGDLTTTVKVVSPPPPLSMTVEKSTTHQIIRANETSQNTNNNIVENVTPPPSPPSGFGSDSGVTTSDNNKSTTNNTLQVIGENTTKTDLNDNDDHIFKIPERPAPKRRPNRNKTSSNCLHESTTNSQSSTVYSMDTTDGTLRRSKRGQVPIKYPIFQILFEQSLNRQFERSEKKMQREKQKKSETKEISRRNNKSNSVEPISNHKSSRSTKKGRKKNQLPTVVENDSLTCQNAVIMNQKKDRNAKQSKIRKQNNKSKEIEGPVKNAGSGSLITLDNPPIDHLNNVFDQLKNSIVEVEQLAPLKVKPFKVRVARLKNSSQPTGRCDSMSSYSSTMNKSSNDELISWLKSITVHNGIFKDVTDNGIFKEMRISPACNMCFTELQGIDYAFYDTDEKASLGYLRFKPRQIKPKKRAKRFQLHFIALVGNFRITVNGKESRVGVGDMVAIEKSVYYDIENITDDIGILLVTKK